MADRPRIGLVLSGGGARGLAHVGVLKVLEELRVPIDVIAGTSMGAIVGGLYASGLGADELERELLKVQWADVFANRVARPLLSQRRKEEDFEISPLVELGLREGELRTPNSAVSGRGLESLLRRFTLPVRDVQRFDKLPIPFRAVATDMETGRAKILASGDLALALRSSMSVPGIFPPIEWEGQVLGDGGLVNNLPIDVARSLGAELLIVVNVGTPLAGRDTLATAVGLTAQMVNILTEQNVQRSLSLLEPQDLLLSPDLAKLGSGDFEQTALLIAKGEAAARAHFERLAALSLSGSAYAAWREQHRAPDNPLPRLAEVKIEGSTLTNAGRLSAMLESKPGQPFDAARAERDTRRLAAGGDYARSDYQLRQLPDAASPARGAAGGGGGTGLVFDLEDKTWGPNYLRAGLDMGTDFRGQANFNLKLSHNRHWLTPSGTEWRNRLQIGSVPKVYTELYHPLDWTASRANDWFVSAYTGLERYRQLFFGENSGQELAMFRRSNWASGLDIGQPWGDFGELRLGWSYVQLRATPLLVDASLGPNLPALGWNESAVRARAVVDQLDFAAFPQSGYRAQLELWAGQRSGDLSGQFWRMESEGLLVGTRGANTFSANMLLNTAELRGGRDTHRYTLGGFHRLSGYKTGQLSGNHLFLLRLGWYRRLNTEPSITRGFFVGGTVEAGQVWVDRSAMSLSDLRAGFSLFIGADTGIGPLYLGLTYAPRGHLGLALFIGRP